MKKVLILGGALHQVYIIKKAKEMGLYVITCDYLPENPGHKYADEYYNVSTTEPELVLELATRLKVDGVICYGSDVSAKTAAYVCEKLGLSTNPLRAVEILTRKDLFREYLQQNKFNTPEAVSFVNYKQALSALKTMEYPVIMKPVDSSGSKGVNKIGSKLEAELHLAEFVEEALLYSKEKKGIIENFIEKQGAQISGDIFVVDGKIVFWSFGNEYYSSLDIKEYVPIGEYWPLEHSKTVEERLIEELQKLITALEYKMGECNVEAIVDKEGKVYIIELGPRSGGSLIPQLIQYTTGTNLLEYIVWASIGESCAELSQQESKGYWANYNIPSAMSGVLEEIWIQPDFKEQHVVEFVTEHKKGDSVKKFQNGSDAVGLVIMRFENKRDMDYCLENITEYIKVTCVRDELGKIS